MPDQVDPGGYWAQQIIGEKTGKRIRFRFTWRDTVLDFGEILFKTDNSLVLALSAHSQTDLPLQFGLAYEKDGVIGHFPKKTDSMKSNGGFHLTIHPPKLPEKSHGIIHIKDNSRTFARRRCDWFPIEKQHSLCMFTTDPLTECRQTLKNPSLTQPVLDDYEDSVLFVIDLFPRSLTHMPSHPQAVAQFIGNSPQFWVRTAIIPLAQKWTSVLYVPHY